MIKLSNFLNPFSEFLETKTYFNSRVLRTGFWQKIVDTFSILAGSSALPTPPSLLTKKDHIGLLDYATLGIPYAIGELNAWALNDNGEKGDTLLNVPAIILTTPITTFFLTARIFVAGILTAAVSPGLAILHLINKSKGNHLQSKVDSIPVTPIQTNLESPLMLGKVLKEWDTNLEGIKIDCVGTTKNIKLTFKTKFLKSPIATANLDLDKKEDKKAFSALLKLNVGGVTHKLEKRSIFCFFSRQHKNKELANKENKLTIDTTRKLR